MQYSRLGFLILSVILSFNTIKASSSDPRHRVGTGIDFNGDMYSVGVNYHYMLCPFAGIGAEIGIWRETSSDGLLDDLTWDWDYDYRLPSGPTAFYFEPSAVVVTPNFITRSNFALGMTFKPWVRFSTNYHIDEPYLMPSGAWTVYSYKCRTVTFGCNLGPTFYFGPLALTVGYQISTIDTMRSYRYTSSGTLTYSSKPSQGLFVELSATF